MKSTIQLSLGPQITRLVRLGVIGDIDRRRSIGSEVIDGVGGKNLTENRTVIGIIDSSLFMRQRDLKYWSNQIVVVAEDGNNQRTIGVCVIG